MNAWGRSRGTGSPGGPHLQSELTNAIIEALDARTLMSTQALKSEAVRDGIKDLLLNHARLCEALRSKLGAGQTGTH